MKKNAQIILYLDRQKIVIASSGLSSPQTLEIPLSIVFDIEVIDPDGFNNLITGWFEQIGIAPTEVIIVLSANVYYLKDLAFTNDLAVRKSQSETFLTNIPYKNLYSKEYVFDNQIKLVAINKDFYEPLIRILKKQRYIINSILPIFLLDSLKLSLVEFTSKETTVIYKKSKILSTHSLITPQEIDKTMSASVRRAPENQNRQIILISVFVALLLVFSGLLFLRPKLYKPAPTPTLKKPIVTNIVITEPTLTPTPSISYLNMQQVRIKVINSSGIPNQAGKIRDRLSVLGFQNVTVTTSGKVTGLKNQINHNQNVSQDMLVLIKDNVSNIASDSTITQIDNLSDTDVLITLISR